MNTLNLLIFTTLGARPPLQLDAIYYTWLRAPRRSVLNSIQVEGGAPPSVVNSSQVAGGAQLSVTNNSKEHPEGLQHRFSTAGHTAFPPNSYRPWAGVGVFIVVERLDRRRIASVLMQSKALGPLSRVDLFALPVHRRHGAAPGLRRQTPNAGYCARSEPSAAHKSPSSPRPGLGKRAVHRGRPPASPRWPVVCE